MGQGGSTGRMNHTAIDVIPEIGKQVWARYARDLVHFPKKRIIGWSTGGLAAYYTASRNEADQVVLIAPGIAPNAVVGEGLWNWPPDEITLESLTTDRYLPGQVNPHVDPIRPNSPAKVPSFAVRLLTTAFQSGKWKIPSTVSGFVLLSGDDDTYVNSEKTKNIVSRNASHFLLKNYAGALHEIDNERVPIREEAHQDILNFLKNGTI
jgi:alpha-beta hydrolase superfamily lysophospholipase